MWGKRQMDNGLWEATTNCDNLQFEAEETFLVVDFPKNPEPVVYSDNTPEGNAVSKPVRTMLQFHADQLVLRRKLGVTVRQWSIYHLGVIKPGFDKKINDIAIENRKIQDFIFDPNGYVDAYGDFTSYLGERITVTASRLAELYPKHKQHIEEMVESRMGTECVYTEWWTDDYCFVTYRDIVLDKFKNPYFKYESPATDPMGQPLLDDAGQPVIERPRNHFAYPKKPYVFLSVFSLQTQPHDITGLIEQNIPNQNLISKRTDQIDVNISKTNNAVAFSEDNFNQQTAKQVPYAMRKGNPLLVPSGGPIDRAILPLNAQDLPSSVFAELENNKNNLRTSWEYKVLRQNHKTKIKRHVE